MNIWLYRASNLKSTIIFWPLILSGSQFLAPVKTFNSCDLFIIIIIIREYGSTLYVGLARAVSPTNTNFQLTFLLTRLQEALYEDLAV